MKAAVCAIWVLVLLACSRVPPGVPGSAARMVGAERDTLTCEPTPRNPAAPSADLHCLELVPTPDLEEATGIVELRRAPSPFGIAVSVEGHHEHDLVATIAGLPPPGSLGEYATYVAWLTTPVLEPMVKLGQIGNGRVALGRSSFEKFLVLVSAEKSADVEERAGRLVLRGMSPSTLMRPQTVNELPPGMAKPSHAHDAAHHRWVAPPMHPGVANMPPGLHELAPPATPFLPGARVDVAAIPPARPAHVVDLADGDTLALEAALVRRSIAGRAITMYGFNGQYPGPLIRVAERATITVRFTNRIDLPSTIHWHGVRLENRFDGVPGVTQELVPPGGSFTYVVHFPDAGIYWYHPHHREDITQDLGLYGNLFVRPARADYYNPVNREEVLIVDDILLTADGSLVPYGAETTTHALMGRFGNVLLVNGRPDARMRMARGEVVRFFLTNASNTRTFNLSFTGARMKVVGSDVGKLEREEWVESVVIAPAERYIVEARFDDAGASALVNRVRAIDHTMGRFFGETDTLVWIAVDSGSPPADHGATFEQLREHADVAAELERFRAYFDKPVDRELVLTLRTKDLPFGLVQALRLDTGYVNPVEWSGTMPMMDWLSTGRQVEWVLRDAATGAENMDIGWRFVTGEIVKIRLRNDRHTIHPMQHPIHLHGQRFLVLAQNGVASQNLVWKDTMLLPTGGTADLLVDMSNPGRWMLHCHIAEHLEAGMHMVLEVGTSGGGAAGAHRH